MSFLRDPTVLRISLTPEFDSVIPTRKIGFPLH
jgi:hypothetical protein